MALDEIAAGRFRGPWGLTGPLSFGPPQGDGVTWVTLADSAWIYTTNLPPAVLHIHLSQPTTLLFLPEALAAERQRWCLLLFPSLWLIAKNTLKVKTLRRKQPSPNDNENEQKSWVQPKTRPTKRNQQFTPQECLWKAQQPEWKMRISRGK